MLMYNEEELAYNAYRIIGIQAITELNKKHDGYIYRARAIRFRDEYKKKADREYNFNESNFGRFWNSLRNRIDWRYWYEAYDLMLAHMNIMGVNSLNVLQFSEVVFDKEIYEKYFKENFVECEKVDREILHYAQMSKQEQKDYEKKRIHYIENRIPKYGEVKLIESQEQNE